LTIPGKRDQLQRLAAMRDHERGIGVLAAAAGLLCASAASAATAPPATRVALAWSSPDPTCVGAGALAQTVERTLRRPVFEPVAGEQATISGRVAAGTSGGYEATVTLQAADGALVSQRVLTTELDCPSLDDSIAVVVALMVDSLDEGSTALRVPEPASHARAQIGLAGFGVGVGASYGLLPGFAGMAVVRGDIRVGSVGSLPAFALALRLHTPADASAPGAGVTFTAWDAELATCPAITRSRVRGGVCLGAGAGTLDGSPTGAVLDAHGSLRPLLLVSALPYGALRIVGGLWLRADAGVFVPLLRDNWGFQDASGKYVEVYRTSAVAPLASISLELRTGS
jgi:hypothetical protein